MRGGGKDLAIRMLKRGEGGDISICFTENIPVSISFLDSTNCTMEVKSSSMNDNFQVGSGSGGIITKTQDKALSEETSSPSAPKRRSIKTHTQHEQNQNKELWSNPQRFRRKGLLDVR